MNKKNKIFGNLKAHSQLTHKLKRKAHGKCNIQSFPRVKTTTHQIQWEMATVVCRRKSIAGDIFILKQERQKQSEHSIKKNQKSISRIQPYNIKAKTENKEKLTNLELSYETLADHYEIDQ